MAIDLAVAHDTTPFLTAYPWTTGSGFGAKYSNPSTLPAGLSNDVEFSPSAADIATAQNVSPFISAWKWTPGSGFGTKYSNPASLPAGIGRGLSFANAGNYLAI